MVACDVDGERRRRDDTFFFDGLSGERCCGIGCGRYGEFMLDLRVWF